jgi:hypothetical protein
MTRKVQVRDDKEEEARGAEGEFGATRRRKLEMPKVGEVRDGG